MIISNPGRLSTGTTQFFITKTARLRAWARGLDPWTIAALAFLAGAVLVGGLSEAWPRPTTTPLAYATPALAPRIGDAHADRDAPGAPSQPRPTATPLPTPARIPVYAAPSEDAPIIAELPAPIHIENAPAEQQPTVDVPIGYLQTPVVVEQIQLTPTADVTIRVVNADDSTAWTFDCKPYGDWRDQSSVYAHPECHR